MVVEGWKTCALGDVIEIKHGFAFNGKYFRDDPPGDLLLTPGNFAIGGGFKADKLKYYMGPVLDEFVLSEGDLLITMTDLSKQSDTLGYPAIVPRRSGPRFLHNQRLGKVLIREGAELDKRFLFYLLCTIEYRQEILASATGTTVKHTSPSRIMAHKVTLPPLEEQRSIAHVLGTIDDKIRIHRRMNVTMEELAQALFRSWFVDFDPVHAKAGGRAPFGIDEGVASLFPDGFVDSSLGPIPKGWRISTIGEEVKVVGGSTPKTSDPKFWDGGTIHWVTPKDLSRLREPIVIDTERYITQAGLAEISSGLLPVGTVLLSSRAPIGYLAVTAVPVAINQGFVALVCEDTLSSHYVFHWCRQNMNAVLARAGGTTFAEISKMNFRPIPVIVPTRDVLAAFESIVSPLYSRMEANVRETQTLAALREILLPKLLSGELRIHNLPDTQARAG